MYPHRIRLRGPWECQTAEGTFRVTMPCRWVDTGRGDLGGPVRCRRRFGYPGRIDAHERVWLTFGGVTAKGLVLLNDAHVGEIAEAGGEFEITTLLRARNGLLVDIEGPPGKAGLWGEVALEVRCTAFLRGVSVQGEVREGRGEVRVFGEVIGTADAPLDLYVILGRSPVAETRVQAAPAGQPFRLTAGGLAPELLSSTDPETGEAVQVRVELVHGAVVWYATTGVIELAAGREAENS
jgi:hypothetical protein